jgi:DNA-binding CsgD family transcriptional regulator
MEVKHGYAQVNRPESNVPVFPAHLRADRPDHPVVLVTPRQLEIIKYVADGATDRHIAVTLSLSTRTVSNTLHRLYDRIGASSRARLASLYAQGQVRTRPTSSARRPGPL